jgi:hypothetical protein
MYVILFWCVLAITVVSLNTDCSFSKSTLSWFHENSCFFVQLRKDACEYSVSFITREEYAILFNGIVGRKVESNWVHSALRPQICLLCQPRIFMMMEKLVEWLAGETVVLGENLPQCRFIHHKPHMLPWCEPGLPRWEASDWPLELWQGHELLNLQSLITPYKYGQYNFTVLLQHNVEELLSKLNGSF